MTTWRALVVRVGLWIAAWGGWTPCARAHVPEDAEIAMTRAIVADIEARWPGTPGPVKAREAQRVLLNLRPGATPRDLNLLIELALQ